MAATTDVPWVNRVDDVAPRNGTTTHTIAFGFTPRPGALLVVLIFGGVTNAVTGWTEQLQPIASGEMSVFTKTASGDTSILVDHGSGSNYPVAYTILEYPVGSVYVSGVGSSDTNNTFPALTGLPVTELVIHAFRGVVVANATTTASAVWAFPFTEDVDRTFPGTPTDGVYITGGHLTNSVAASVTPAVTVTPSAAFVNGDREQVVFAINAAVIPPTGGSPIEYVDGAGTAQSGYATWWDGTTEQYIGSIDLT